MARIKHQTSFTVNQPAEVVFPLFSAEGEKYWVPGWDYENIMGSTGLHEDYIFLTPNHHRPAQHSPGLHNEVHHAPGHSGLAPHSASKIIWLVKRYQPEHFFVQYYRVEPGDKVGIVTVKCHAVDEDKTKVDVTYEYIGLCPAGDEFVNKYTAEAHEAFVLEWPSLLANYFEHGSL